MANPATDPQTTQVNNLINVQIPGWNKLFGAASQCECNECESMTGAPHYLASILSFLETCTPNQNLVITDPKDNTKKNGETPYDILIKRVPYLPDLPLTCENTNTDLPYIQVVLEILEYYAALKSLAGIPAYDSGTDNWEATYLVTEANAYQILSTVCYPFTLPYHQPLDIIRTYLSKLRISFAELIKTFGTQDNNIELRLIKEYLVMSDEEYSLLTQFKIKDQTFEVFDLFGFSASVDFQNAIYNVAEFLQRTGLQYAELIAVLSTEFINPGINAVNFIEGLFINGSADAKALFPALKDIKNSILDDTFDAGLGVKIKNLLQQSETPGLDPRAFKSWVDNNFDDLQHTVIIIPDQNVDDSGYDPCNYSDSTIGTILSINDATVVPPITDEQFKRLYLFIRLLRRSGLQINELDNLLNPVTNKTNDEILATGFAAGSLVKKFQLSSGQSACFYGRMDSIGDTSTYAQLFLNNALNQVNSAFLPDEFGNLFTKSVPLKNGDQYNIVLLSALKLLPVQLDALVTYFTIDPTKFNLSVNGISVFYSYALLAKSLNLQMSDLVDLITAYGNPAALRAWNGATNNFNDADLQATLSFIEFTDVLNASEFSVTELLFVLGKRDDAAATSLITDDAINQMLITLQQGAGNIDQQNPAAINEPGIDGNLIKNKLLQLYDKDTVLQFIGMLDGTIVYGISTTAIPPPNVPESLAGRITSTTNNGVCRLAVTGTLTSADWAALDANPAIKLVLQPIFDKPFDFLKSNFSQFILTDDDRNKLLGRFNNQDMLLADKLNLFYSAYQPYLVKQLKCQLIIQQIAALVLLDDELTGLVMQGSIDDFYQSISTIIGEISTAAGYFPQAEVADLKNKITLLCKSSLFISKFGLNAREVAWFINSASDFSNITFKDFSLQQWQSINNYLILKNLNRSAQFSFIDLFAMASAAQTTIQAIAGNIALLTGWQKEDIAGIINANGFGANDFRNEKNLTIMNQMMQMVNATGIKATQLSIWAKSDTQFNSLVSLASTIKNAVLLQYDISIKNSTEATISADILQNQRDALVSYILTLDEIKKAGITDIEELCGWFLIDVPMNACMPTTRIRQAISSVQSFVKRCLMNLESVKDAGGMEIGVLPEYIFDDIWEPISFFRTWQVKMEFLTNPYPYLSYKYLIDKSGAAKTFEETLLKSDITEEAVEDAYRIYLSELNETANLAIVSMYIDDVDTDNKPSTKLIHVIGKSRAAPPNYYYSTKDEEDKWSFWEKIPVAIKENDMDSNSPSGGAGVIFTKFKGRYYLLLPEFVKRQVKSGLSNQTLFNDLSSKKIADVQAAEYWEVKMAVSEYYNGKWGPKKYLQTSGDFSLFQTNVTGDDISIYFFTTRVGQDANARDTLELSLHSAIDGFVTEKMKFVFVSINSAITISAGSGSSDIQNTGIAYQNVKLDGPMIFPVASNETPPVILSAAGEKFFNFSPQYSSDLGSIYSQPFFFHDKDRSYYVTSQAITYTVQKAVTEIQVFPPSLQLNASIVNIVREPQKTLYYPMHITQ